MIARGPQDPRWHHLASCGSTNDEAARLGRNGAPGGTVVIADAQERGRGRQGHRWYSPPGENLYLSVLLRPALPPARAPLLTLAAGVATAEVLTALVSDAGEVEIKWPNDLLLRAGSGPARKVAGLLTETASEGGRLAFVVVGIGVNVNSTVFPAELTGRATSLRLCTGRALDPLALGGQLAAALERWSETYLHDGAAPVLARFATFAAFLRRGSPIEVRGSPGPPLRGLPAGLAEDGALLLRTEDGALQRVLCGEVEETASHEAISSP